MAFPHDGKKFKEGQCGNPKGRPKLPDLKEAMAELLGGEKNGKTGLQKIIDKLQQMALAGNVKAADMLLSRGYGLPKDVKEVTIHSQPVILNWGDTNDANKPDTEAEGSEAANRPE